MAAQITTLDNGLRIVSEHLPGVQTATLGMWVGVGSRYEAPHENGLSHFLEHMAFKGTHNRTAAQIATEIEDVGGYLNAYTSRETTAYHARVLAENVPHATEIIGDILQNSVFDENEVEKERAVILQEIHQSHDTPDDIIFENFQLAAFPDQPLGRSILGPESIISQVSSEQLKKYMSDHYTASRMVFAATGGVDHDHLVKLCEAHLAELPTTPQSKAHPGSYQGGQHVDTRKSEQVHLLMGFESLKQGHPDYFTLAVLSSLLGGGMSSRLFQEIREKRGLVYSIYSFNSSFRDTGLFGIYAGTAPDKVREIMPLISGVFNELAGTLCDKEIERNKTQLKAGLMMGLESTTARCEQLANHMLTHGKPLTPQDIISKVDIVSSDDIITMASKLFSSEPTFAAVGPGDLKTHLVL